MDWESLTEYQECVQTIRNRLNLHGKPVVSGGPHDDHGTLKNWVEVPQQQATHMACCVEPDAEDHWLHDSPPLLRSLVRAQRWWSAEMHPDRNDCLGPWLLLKMLGLHKVLHTRWVNGPEEHLLTLPVDLYTVGYHQEQLALVTPKLNNAPRRWLALYPQWPHVMRVVQDNLEDIASFLEEASHRFITGYSPSQRALRDAAQRIVSLQETLRICQRAGCVQTEQGTCRDC